MAKQATAKTTETNKPTPTAITAQHVIRKLVTGNPKKEGTTAHLKFGLIKDGMTVKDFREACKAHEALNGRTSLKWDLDHGYVALEAPDKTEAKGKSKDGTKQQAKSD